MRNPIYNWLIALVALIVGLIGAFGPFDAPARPLAEVDWLDVAGESALLLGALAFALNVHSLELPADTRRLFFFAAIFFIVAQTQDVLDELRMVSAFLPGFVENMAKMVGIGTLAGAMLNIVRTMRQAHAEREAYRTASRTDSLTGLGNRQDMDATLVDLVNEAGTGGHMLSVVFLDVDDFKQTNDAYGHALGDRVLQALADVIRTTIRGGDFAFRLGGEEFLIVLPGTSVVGARLVAERVRGRFAQVSLPANPRAWQGTISLGVAQLGTGDSVQSLVRRADEAMYAAKRAGKDQVAVAGDGGVSAAPPAAPSAGPALP